MSVLLWSQQAAGFAIITDTLSADPCRGTLAALGSKVRAVPGLNMVICGVGAASFVGEWANWVQTGGFADAAEVHAFAPRVIPLMYADFLDRFRARSGSDQLPHQMKATLIYHFAFVDGETVAYIYTSQDGFVGVEVRGGYAESRPALNDGTPFTGWDDYAGMIAWATKIKKQEDALPADEALTIGGELWLTVVTDGAIEMSRQHRFADYDDIRRQLRPHDSLILSAEVDLGGTRQTVEVPFTPTSATIPR